MSGSEPEESGSSFDAAEEEVGLPDKLFFRIGEAAELIGVEPHVLRYWESEFRMRPQRSQSGQRMYRRADIARFLKIRRLLHDEGFTIAGARKALLDPSQVDAGGVAPSAVDASRLHQVLERIEATRDRLADLRVRLAQIGTYDRGDAE
ncbi:MAG: MerR family transcriptional regulator [Myxococcota bacterium]